MWIRYRNFYIRILHKEKYQQLYLLFYRTVMDDIKLCFILRDTRIERRKKTSPSKMN